MQSVLVPVGEDFRHGQYDPATPGDPHEPRADHFNLLIKII